MDLRLDGRQFDSRPPRLVLLGWVTVFGRENRLSSATGRALDFAISRSRVQILLEATLRNNLGQVVHTYVPLSASSINWYRPNGGDALRLGR